MRIKGGKKGFTLVELSLSIGFIAILSLTITLIINDTAATYRRGITLNQVNTTGMDLVDDFRAAIQNSPVRSPRGTCSTMFTGSSGGSGNSAVEKCESDDAGSMIILRRMGYVDVDEDGEIDKDDSDDGGSEKIPVFGAICLGSFTYIWNSGYYFGENATGVKANEEAGSPRVPQNESGMKIGPATFSYNYTDDEGNWVDPPEKDDFRLLKVKDPQRGVCKNVIQKVAYERNHLNTTTDSKVDEYLDASYWADNLPESFASRISKDDEYSGYMNYFPQEVREEDIEVVLDNTSTNPLALYDFTITTPATNSAGEAAFYSSSFILGTLTGGINVKAKGNFCKTPEDYIDEDFDYCAINKFNFAAQATGG